MQSLTLSSASNEKGVCVTGVEGLNVRPCVGATLGLQFVFIRA